MITLDDISPFKFCKGCCKELPISSFHKKKDSTHTLCKGCRSVSRKLLPKKALTEDQKQKARESVKNYRLRNLQLCKDRDKQSYQKNRLNKIKSVQEWKRANLEKFKKTQRLRLQSPKGIEKTRFYNAFSKRRRLQRVPLWLSKTQLEDINNFYWLAKDLKVTTGEIYHVDHIIPLRGKDVCGLHVPWNLQILPSDLNLKKGNKWE